VSNSGVWLGEYVPALYRTYPFRLARNDENVEVLCIDETFAQVSDSTVGEPFFMPDGSPSPPVAEVFTLLSQIDKEHRNTEKACEVLARHSLFEPWPLRVQDGAELHEPGGLLRIAESKLYSLDSAALIEIRDCGGLMLAFGQLFSMHQIYKLGKLGTTTPSGAMGQQPPKLSEENGIISFDNL
jgi:hypothetical protein